MTFWPETANAIMTMQCGVCPVESDGRQLTASSPSKLNVFLEVHGKRPDGFHELETVMLRTSLADQLSVRSTDDGLLTLRFSEATTAPMRAGVPLDDRNLILRATAAVREAAGVQLGAEFVLHKRIPPQSGLGGGSGNAATALLLCRQLWNVTVPDAMLHDIAASLGSDISFLLSGHAAAVCRGRGERVEPIPLAQSFHVVALRPQAGNSTADVFRATTISPPYRSIEPVVAALASSSGRQLERQCFNRLTCAARELNPEMARLMDRVTFVTRRPVFMSGSGSTIFVVANSRADAEQVAFTMREQLRVLPWVLKCGL